VFEDDRQLAQCTSRHSTALHCNERQLNAGAVVYAGASRNLHVWQPALPGTGLVHCLQTGRLAPALLGASSPFHVPCHTSSAPRRFAEGAGSLLDFACGRGGDIWKWIDAGIPRVKGIDLSPGEIEEARKR